MIFVNQLLSAAVQAAVLTAIPLVWYAAAHRKISGFTRWLGLYRAEHVPAALVLGIAGGFLAVTALPYLWLYHRGCISYSGFPIDAYRAGGWNLQTIGTILVWAGVQTSLSEEIFFRGFLCKRLCRAFGTGCLIQALVFGAIHLPAVYGQGVLPALTVAALTGGVGYALGWLSMEKAHGSILYGWAVHAAVNIVSPVIVFLWLL